MDAFFNTPLNFKTLKLANRVIYSPLAGCSDFPFRKIAARFRPGLMFCEMVKMEPLVLGNENTLRMLDYSEDMRPIGGQICGSKKELTAPAAKIIEDHGFDVVDLNCGCPVDKVTKDGSGSGMLKNPERIGELIHEMTSAVSIPVTVKIRIGWDYDSINAAEVVKIAEQAGAAAIFVHGRTRSQGYKGPAKWEYIKECKAAATSIKVIGNGDVFSPEAAFSMVDETGCDAVLASRGTMGQPWLVEDILRAALGKSPRSYDAKQALIDHFELSASYKTERGALIDMRKVCCWYLKNSPGAKKMRSQASQMSTLDEIRELIHAS
ncbi:MAG: tRNA-dihydrouridine synthase B [Chlamydiales bacterium]|nr:tRNA-dihydrouridine synthase B [Chlamydiales bacterium]MCH9619582.1 tRNA-dihydrouridine synthase B [Chlamydiales bacterium]MCH9623188.1 tRNA-dihydrouridine synthase B [Chlamydiales bacterium]